MLKKSLIVLMAFAATPAWADCCHSGRYWAHWHRYPNYAACIPYGVPFVPYSRTTGFVPGIGAVPERVYYVPLDPPFYNVPPYRVIAPY